MSRVSAIGSGIVQYLKGAYTEFRAVTWPSRHEITRYTIIVIITIIICVLIISGFDYIFQQLTNRFLIR